MFLISKVGDDPYVLFVFHYSYMFSKTEDPQHIVIMYVLFVVFWYKRIFLSSHDVLLGRVWNADMIGQNWTKQKGRAGQD